MIHLSAVRRLVDIVDQEDCDASVMSNMSTVTMTPLTPSNLVAIVCRYCIDRCIVTKLSSCIMTMCTG